MGHVRQGAAAAGERGIPGAAQPRRVPGDPPRRRLRPGGHGRGDPARAHRGGARGAVVLRPVGGDRVRFAGQPAVYALEGSVAIPGALVQWLRDNFGLIEKSSDIEVLARTVNDNGGVYFVPPFAGL